MEIRETTLEDLDGLQALLETVWHDTYDETMGVERVDEITRQWHSRQALERELRVPQTDSLVAVDDDGLAGHALAIEAADGLIKLSRLYVRTNCQGGGVGHALFQAVLARHPDAAAIELEVEEANGKARGFYEKQGFEVIRRESNCGDQDGIPTLIMQRVPHSGA